MPRPNLDLGTAGAVRVYPVASGGFRAMTRYREWNGATFSIERRGATKGAATRALALAIRDRSQASGGADITPDTKVDVLADLWFAEISSRSLSPSTLQLYGDRLTNQVRPALGALKIRELTVGSIDRHLKVVKAVNGPAIAKTTRTVLSGLCNLACRHDALPSNPCRDVGRLGAGPKNPPTSLSADEIKDLRRRLANDEIAREADIVDLIDLLMASGLRLGEAMALRWADIDLNGGTLEVVGTALRIRGKGVVIKPSAKSTAGQRILELPSWAVDMLRHRHEEKLGDLVFPAPRSGSVRDRSNTSRALRKAFARVGYPGLTSHIFRGSVATMMSDAGLSSRAAADQLGHQKVSLTTDVYFGRKKRVTGAAQVLEQLDIED
jgi:integrase